MTSTKPRARRQWDTGVQSKYFAAINESEKTVIYTEFTESEGSESKGRYKRKF
jgi:hypothetical protein